MRRWTSSTTASVKNPRAMPDWLLTITTARPARFSDADRVDRPRKELDAFGAIEIADFFDDGAVAVEEDRALECLRHSVRSRICRAVASTRLRRCRACRRDRAGTRASRTAGTTCRCVSIGGSCVDARQDEAPSAARQSGRTQRSTLRPRAAPRCSAPESFAIERAAIRQHPRERRNVGAGPRHLLMSRRPATARRHVAAPPRDPRRRRPSRSPLRLPPDPATRSANAAAGQRFADPYAAPGAIAVNGDRPSHPAPQQRSAARGPQIGRDVDFAATAGPFGKSERRRRAAGSSRSDEQQTRQRESRASAASRANRCDSPNARARPRERRDRGMK